MPAALTLQENWGCQLIAYVLDTMTYGMGALLVMQYYRSHSKNDSVLIRLSVALLFIFATLQLAFLSHQVYIDFVTWIGIPDNLDIMPFSASAQLLAVYLTAFTAQQFFASRIWIFSPPSQRIIFVAPVVLLSFLQIGFGITQTILVVRVGTFSRLESTARYTSTQAGCTAACDIVITVMLCWLLHNSRTGLRKTDSIVDKLILYAINRGAATSLAALMNLILFVSVPNTFLFMIFLLPSCQMYVLSVVSMLTSRESLRQQLWKGTNSDHSTIPMENFRPNNIRIDKSVVSWQDGAENSGGANKPNLIPSV